MKPKIETLKKLFLCLLAASIGYVTWHARRVRQNPDLSSTRDWDRITAQSAALDAGEVEPLSRRQKLVLAVFVLGIAFTVWGIVTQGYYIDELAAVFHEDFDRIIVDAPCSGEGMFRKNEAACGEWSPENVQLCADRQDDILDCAAKMLRPGGRIVYSTCTFAPAENEGSVSRFLQRHPEFELLSVDKERMGLPAGKCDGRPEWCPEADAEIAFVIHCTLRLWPHLVRGEGHFAAVLQNKEMSVIGESVSYEPMAVGGMERGISSKDKSLEPWWSFWRDTASTQDQQLKQGLFLRFGDNLYLAPDHMPSLKGLKVLRPGLQLGAIKKDRFEPSHALALAISPNEIRHKCQFSLADEEQAKLVSMYLNGQKRECASTLARKYGKCDKTMRNRQKELNELLKKFAEDWA